MVSTLTMHVDDQKCVLVVSEVNQFLKELNIPIVNNKNAIRKQLGNKKGLLLNMYGVARLAISFKQNKVILTTIWISK